MKNFKKHLTAGLLTINLILLSLTAAVITTVVISPGVFRLFSKLKDYPALTGLTTDQLNASYQSIISYFLDPWTKYITIENFRSSDGGVIHFYEVRLLLWIVLLVFVVSLIVLIVYKNKRKRKITIRLYNNYIKTAQVLPLILLLVCIIAFDKVFLLFHKLFFRNDLWIFNPSTDPIINVLPESFFMVLFVIGILLYELFLYIFAKLANK